MSMQTAQPIDEPKFQLRRWADIDVRFNGKTDRDQAFDFIVRDSLGVEVERNGDVRFTQALGEYEGSRLSFTLPDEIGAVWELRGIRIGPSEEATWQNPEVKDTGGELYPGTYFQVSNSRREGRLVTLTLTQARGQAPLVQPFYYCYLLAVVDREGKLHQLDPRIYNEGAGGPPPEDGAR